MQRARIFLSQFLRKLIHDGLPVALAGAIGTMLFSQFSRPSAPPPPPVIQEPASEATMEMMREEHTLVLDLLRHQAETSRLGNPPQESPSEGKRLAVPAEERAARARRASPAKAPPILAAKPTDRKQAVAGDPLPLAPSLMADDAAAPAGENKSEPAGSNQVIRKLSEWASRAARLPARLWGVTERLIDDVSPLAVPGREFRAAM